MSAPLPHALFSMQNPELARTREMGCFPLMEGGLLSRSPANRHHHGNSPPPGSMNVAVPSPFLADVDGEQGAASTPPVTFLVGDECPKQTPCEHCGNTEMETVPPPPVMDPSSRAIQVFHVGTISLPFLGTGVVTQLLLCPWAYQLPSTW